MGRCDRVICSALVPSREARGKKEVLSLDYHGIVVDLCGKYGVGVYSLGDLN